MTPDGFQSLIGRLKTRRDVHAIRKHGQFQSLIGRLKTWRKWNAGP